ncbi:hypothetical protein GQ600_6683 [Phytophthora cactorum]|nr:hypothetical protein GQ600_6683 [Phytophthora cactorum]
MAILKWLFSAASIITLVMHPSDRLSYSLHMPVRRSSSHSESLNNLQSGEHAAVGPLPNGHWMLRHSSLVLSSLKSRCN